MRRKQTRVRVPRSAEPPGPRPLSVRIPVAVKMTGISRSRLFELLRDGEVDSVKLGAARLIIVASLERLLERLQQGYVPACLADDLTQRDPR